MFRLRLIVLPLLLALVACGSAPPQAGSDVPTPTGEATTVPAAAPTESENAATIEERNADLPAQILGVWRADTDLTLEFYPDGRLVEVKPSGVAWPGTYTLSPDNTTLSITSDGNTNSSTVVISGTDTLLTFFQLFERVAVIEPDAAAYGPLAERVVGSYHHAWFSDVLYDFYPDGTYAITRDDTVTVAGVYQLGDDGTITLALEPEKAPSTLAVAALADRWMLIGPGLLLRRVAAEPQGSTAPPVAAAATATPLPTPIPAPTATPEPAATTAAAVPTQRFRAIQSSDGFIAVREQPSTRSREVERIPSGGEVVCTGAVAGERLTLLGVTSDQWLSCPDVGGYIFAPLLIDLSAAPAAPTAAAVPFGERDAIIAAVRAHIGDPGFPYQVGEPCVDREHALAAITPDGNQADPGLVILRRGAAGWEVIYDGPGMIVMFPDELARLGVPADFACVSGS
jgi:hypothetical protein